MKLILLFSLLLSISSYNFHNHHRFFALNSKFSNKRFPTKLHPLAEYKRARFFEERRRMYEREKSKKLIEALRRNATNSTLSQ